MPIEVPAALRWWEGRPGGREWLERLPGIIERCIDRWNLSLGEPFPDVRVSYVAPATMSDGTEAVLKITIPEDETECEAEALAHWRGDGAVRLLASDRDDSALLVERLRPGYSLHRLDDASATGVVASLLARLWQRPPPKGHPFILLSDVAARWAKELPAKYASADFQVDPAVLAEGFEALEALGPEDRDLVVLHQDLHAGNVLAAEREPWLAIDPKPLVGPREFDAASILRDRRGDLAGAGGPRLVERRLDILSEELPADRERLRLWGIAHALAWGFDDATGEVHRGHIRAAEILHSLRRRS